jgi:hypothetical protein
MVKKKLFCQAVTLIFVSIVLSGCSRNSESEVAKTGNVNQSVTVSNNNNISINSPNTLTPVVNNNSTTTAPTPANKEKKPAVKEPTPVIGSGGDDMFLFTQVRLALSADKELLNSIIVEIKEGNAALSGSVSTESQKTKAAQLVGSVKGIKSVKNNLRVSR